MIKRNANFIAIYLKLGKSIKIYYQKMNYNLIMKASKNFKNFNN